MNQAALNLDIMKLPIIRCRCGSAGFVALLQLRRVSPIESPDGNAGVAAIHAGYACIKCNSPFDLGGIPVEKDLPHKGETLCPVK